MIIITGILASTSHIALASDSSSLKSLILMPGPLTQAHAKEEKQCESCHGQFDKSAQDALCLDCHKAVAKDIKTANGFHGRVPNLDRSPCKSCHKDHEGRDFNIVPLDSNTFNHQQTDFVLEGKHNLLNCTSCHKKGDLFREAPGQCYDCHQDRDTHQGSLGDDCGSCHQAENWKQQKKFDHDVTEFPLQGQHQKLECSRCHAGQQYTFDDTSCVSCHRVKDIHLGNYGQACDRCHTTKDWQSLAFDHSTETEFPLKGQHQKQPCQACHFNGLVDNAPSTSCVSCHRSSDLHAGRYGEQCHSCHNSKQWHQSYFDHAKKSNWPLTGAHKKLSCLQCHRGNLEEKLDSNCLSCHSADNPHHSDNLKSCASCHQTSSWEQSQKFDHELTNLPLEGMHAIVPCQSCHSGLEFDRAESDCIACHKEDDAHKASMGAQCEQCHSPNGWSLWQFNHDKKTDFKLAGAHKNLSCDSCHQGSRAQDVPATCAGCHAADDRHRGNFGVNCGRCHTSDSFGDVQWQH